MLILGLLGMYFDAVVVFVMNFFSDWLWPYCVGLSTHYNLNLEWLRFMKYQYIEAIPKDLPHELGPKTIHTVPHL